MGSCLIGRTTDLLNGPGIVLLMQILDGHDARSQSELAFTGHCGTLSEWASVAGAHRGMKRWPAAHAITSPSETVFA